MKRNILFLSLLLIVFVFFSCGKQEPLAPELSQSEKVVTTLAKKGENQGLADKSDEELLAMMQEINDWLAANGYDIRIEEIDFFTIGPGRPSVRIHQQPFRWVPGDPRRNAQGDDITFIIDDANNRGPGSLFPRPGFPTAQVRNGMTTWGNDQALQKVDLVERPSPRRLDITIFDGDFPINFCPDADLRGNGLDNFTAADIVHAGWYPASCFGSRTLAFSVTFIFGGDLNGDNYLDTALNEVYFNDRFSWGINVPLGSGFDVETVALHESGHSLGVGHFGPPPDAVMNPIYDGIRHSLFPSDRAAMETVWGSWPNP